MTFDIVTIFPDIVRGAVAAGVVGRALERGVMEVKVHDLRAFTTDRHRVVDDVPYGGGPGMVLKPEPIVRALESIRAERGDGCRVLLTSPQGTRLTHPVAQRLSRVSHLVIVCGRYEGVDERVRSQVDEDMSIGDYVLSGGEWPALVILDTVARFVPGVVGDAQSVEEESFSRGLLDFPHYTRPAELELGPGGTMKVPDVLLSGNHAEIRRWRKRQAVARTLALRPELLETADLDTEEQEILRELIAHRETP
ncbi:MAG: tRNA (guanosine(37)-N1)-methyltransferase TrmD [Vicinamibacterales bacterium]